MAKHLFRVGQRVRHEEFGEGTVTEAFNLAVVTVKFDAGKTRHFSTRQSKLEKLDDGPPPPPLPSLEEWLTTFVLEPEDFQHDREGLWEPFGQLAAVRQELPAMPRESLDQSVYSEQREPFFEIPAGWPTGYYRTWPLRVKGLSFPVIQTPELPGVLFPFLFPFYQYGTQLTLTLEKVQVRRNGIEAVIKARTGGPAIGFYDTQFLSNRGFYMAGHDYDFIVTAIALQTLGLAAGSREDVFPCLVPVPNRYPRQIQSACPEGLPRDEGWCSMASPWSTDIWGVMGTIRTVRPEEMLGCPGWLVTMHAASQDRFPDLPEDLSLATLITERVWHASRPPAAGDSLLVVAWLQGWLAAPRGRPFPGCSRRLVYSEEEDGTLEAGGQP